MIEIKKQTKTKRVPASRVEHHKKNGWSVVEEGAVTATLRPAKAVPAAESEDSTMAAEANEEE